MARNAAFPLNTGVMILATLLASATAFAQANAGGQVSAGNFPPGFDCSALASPATRAECQTFQARRTPDSDVIPPGTPAISMPGQSNSTSGPYIGQNPGPRTFLPGRRPAHGE